MTPSDTVTHPCPTCGTETDHVTRVRWPKLYGQPTRREVVKCMTCGHEQDAPERLEEER